MSGHWPQIASARLGRHWARGR